MGETITPHKLRQTRKWVREAAEAYYAARKLALVACAEYRANPTGRGLLLAREDRLGDAWAARGYHQHAQRHLATAEAAQVVKGSAVSPAAKARLIARGRWNAE